MTGFRRFSSAFSTSCISLSLLVPLAAAACSSSGAPADANDREAPDTGGRTQEQPPSATTPHAADVGDEVIYADPFGGDDRGSGDSAHPVKTLQRAVELARVGSVVQLMDGMFNLDTGSKFPIAVPAGVTIQGIEGGLTILDGGCDTEAALTFSDDAVLKNVLIWNFKDAIRVSHGTVTLTSLDLAQNAVALTAFGDGAIEGRGVWIHDGTAGASIGAAASLTLTDSSIANMGRPACR
jgi:hypothetical protein